VFQRPDGRPSILLDEDGEPAIETQQDQQLTLGEEEDGLKESLQEEISPLDAVAESAPTLDWFEDQTLAAFLLLSRRSSSPASSASTVGLLTKPKMHATSSDFASFLPMIAPQAPLSAPHTLHHAPPAPIVRRAVMQVPDESKGFSVSLPPEIPATAEESPAVVVKGASISSSALRLMAMRGGR
jgi:hypothetical protein